MTGGSWSLRDAVPGDADAIAYLHWKGWEDAYRGLLCDALLDGTTLAMRRAQWPDWMAQKREGLIVAQEADGGLAGFVCAVAARDVAALGAASEIQLLYVRADRQGLGLGSALLRAGAARAAALWPGTMGLWVVVGNAHARRFYERMGGRPGVERREWLRGAPIDEIAYVWGRPQTLGLDCPNMGRLI